MELLYADDALVVCVKPAGVRSTDEVPSLVSQALGDPQTLVRTVHRLDQVVGGLMVLARSPQAASELSRQIREGGFEKEYTAVIHGSPAQDSGRLRDLLYRDRRRCMTLVAQQMDKGVQEAVLDYRVTARQGSLSRVSVTLLTGRTHQIRVQFASRDLPLVGERKYSTLDDPCTLALWSTRLAFTHASTGKRMEFFLEPPKIYPWTFFEGEKIDHSAENT